MTGVMGEGEGLFIWEIAANAPRIGLEGASSAAGLLLEGSSSPRWNWREDDGLDELGESS
jgi:hypothetical protein